MTVGGEYVMGESCTIAELEQILESMKYFWKRRYKNVFLEKLNNNPQKDIWFAIQWKCVEQKGESVEQASDRYKDCCLK